jgi:LacI family transcriptional regulator
MAGIHEVAHRAGVSITTVSHVFSGKRPVAPETRRKVVEAADALDYRPSRTAQGLATGRTMAFGLHIPFAGDVFDPYFPALLQGLSAEAVRCGYGFLLIPSEREGRSALEGLLQARRLDGVIVAEPWSPDPAVRTLIDAGVPTVATGRYLPDPGLPWVDNDYRGAMRDLVAHLDEQGYSRLTLISTGGEYSYFEDIEGSLPEEAGRRAMSATVRHAPDPSEAEAYQHTIELMDGRDPPDSIITCTDRQAVAVVRAADDLGIRVPEELGVASQGDTALAEHARPPLTSVRFHPRELGAAAVRTLLRLLDGERPENGMIPAELVPRRSTQRS